MKKTSLFLRSAAALVLIFSAATSFAQWFDCPPGQATVKPPVSAGTEFLLCFMENEFPGYRPPGDPAEYQDLYIASLDETADITITCKQYPSFNKVITLLPNTSQTIRLTNVPGSVLMQSNEVVDKTVVKVVSTKPIVAYGMNHKPLTSDAFIALPKNVAGTSYMIMAYQNSALATSGSEHPGEFSVAAFNDNTTVTIIPSCQTQSGIQRGTPVKYVLNAGEGVQIQAAASDFTLDLTGSTVESDNVIAVYGGHRRVETPQGFLQPGGGHGSRDHLCEAMPPISTWGKQFITRNFSTPNGRRDQGDVLRILALNNGTSFKINGAPAGTTLAGGTWFDTIIAGPVTIDGSDQILVGMYAHSAASSSDDFGDPFFVIVPPIEQTYNDFTFFISNDPVYADNNYLIVVTDSSGKGNVKLDGQLRPALGYKDIPGTFGNKQWSMETIPAIAPGIHRITSPNTPDKGITIIAYGFGKYDSYGYTAGALLKPFKGISRLREHNPVASAPSGTGSSPQAGIRNILASKVYFDSAVITTSASDKYTVKTKKNIALDIQSLEGGQKMMVDLDVTPLNTDEVISGNMKVYHHTAQWRDLQAEDVPFVIYPQSLTGVKDADISPFRLSAYPNPATSSHFTVNFTLPERTMVTIRLIDPTGRIVRVIASSIQNEGDNAISVDTRGLVAGIYTCEIIAPNLAKSERRQIAVVK